MFKVPEQRRVSREEENFAGALVRSSRSGHLQAFCGILKFAANLVDMLGPGWCPPKVKISLFGLSVPKPTKTSRRFADRFPPTSYSIPSTIMSRYRKRSQPTTRFKIGVDIHQQVPSCEDASRLLKGGFGSANACTPEFVKRLDKLTQTILVEKAGNRLSVPDPKVQRGRESFHQLAHIKSSVQ